MTLKIGTIFSSIQRIQYRYVGSSSSSAARLYSYTVEVGPRVRVDSRKEESASEAIFEINNHRTKVKIRGNKKSGENREGQSIGVSIH